MRSTANQVYRVGCFTLEPYRQFLRGGVPVAIGRKPLALLSVLAEAAGDLVTKDELLDAVWPGMIVEENALHAQITALRKLLGADADLLTTVRGIGYRLAASPVVHSGKEGQPSAALAGHALFRARNRTRMSIAALIFGGVLVFGAASLWVLRLRQAVSKPSGQVVVLPFRASGTGGSAALAAGLPEQIMIALSKDQVPATSVGAVTRGAEGGARPGRYAGADLLVDGSVTSAPAGPEVTAQIVDARDGTLLWSATIAGNGASPASTKIAVAAHLADPIKWAVSGLSGPVKLDSASLSAFVAARASIVGMSNAGAEIAEYQRVVDRVPGFSSGWSGLAAAEAFTAMDDPSSPAAARLRDAAVAAAAKALRIEPHNGEAYLAIEAATPRTDWLKREQLLSLGATVDPGFEPVTLMEGRLLWSVGRTGEAVQWLERAHSLSTVRLSPAWSLALVLASTDQVGDAAALARTMAAEWPETDRAKLLPMLVATFAGRYRQALAILDQHRGDPGMSPAAMTTWRLALRAAAEDGQQLRQAAARQIVAAVSAGQLDAGPAAMLLAMVDDIDDAFAQAEAYQTTNPSIPPYLFAPPSARLWRDPRFIRLAHRLGIVRYWRITGRWPDFCTQPSLPYDCRREAARYEG